MAGQRLAGNNFKYAGTQSGVQGIALAGAPGRTILADGMFWREAAASAAYGGPRWRHWGFVVQGAGWRWGGTGGCGYATGNCQEGYLGRSIILWQL